LNQFSDKELLEKIKRDEGKYQAFEILVRRHQEKLYTSIRRMLRNHDDTNDVIQNVFLKAWKNLEKFKGDSAFYTWLYRIAYNETINFVNANKKHRHADLDTTEHKQAKNIEADHVLDGEQIKRKLDAAIARLPEKQKMVFNMKYFEEKKYAEIAQITGTSEGALKASYFHAVKKIEEFLKRD